MRRHRCRRWPWCIRRCSSSLWVLWHITIWIGPAITCYSSLVWSCIAVGSWCWRVRVGSVGIRRCRRRWLRWCCACWLRRGCRGVAWIGHCARVLTYLVTVGVRDTWEMFCYVMASLPNWAARSTDRTPNSNGGIYFMASIL